MAKNTVLKQSIRDRILKNSTIKDAAILAESRFFQPKDFISTPVPMINVALSGDVDGGLIPGVLMIAGPSKHFKTGFALMMAKAYLDKYEDSAVMFLDSEFGSPQSYFEAYGIPLDRVIHIPITDVEQAKTELVTQLNGFQEGDRVVIVMDSIGNLASKKEIDDALAGESKADFTRAKALKSLFRMITPHLTMKQVPLVAVNHSYKTIEMYSKDQVGGGTGAIYGANDIWILGRQQEKDGKDLTGWNFVINIDKSRFVKEKSKIIISVSFENGIHKWSGLFDEALNLGIIESPKTGWYKMASDGEETKMFQKGQVENSTNFWTNVFATTDFKDMLRNKFKLPTDKSIMEDDEVVSLETGEVA